MQVRTTNTRRRQSRSTRFKNTESAVPLLNGRIRRLCIPTDTEKISYQGYSGIDSRSGQSQPLQLVVLFKDPLFPSFGVPLRDTTDSGLYLSWKLQFPYCSSVDRRRRRSSTDWIQVGGVAPMEPQSISTKPVVIPQRVRRRLLQNFCCEFGHYQRHYTQSLHQLPTTNYKR